MKIAGRKNDGAWYRTNRALEKLDPTSRGSLQDKIDGITEIEAAHSAVSELVLSSGSNATDWFATPADWAHDLASKVPRSVYIGNWAYDTYTKDDSKTPPRYVKDHGHIATAFAEKLRQAYKEFLFGRRQVLDIANKKSAQEGNPGGVADATKGT